MRRLSVIASSRLVGAAHTTGHQRSVEQLKGLIHRGLVGAFAGAGAFTLRLTEGAEELVRIRKSSECGIFGVVAHAVNLFAETADHRVVLRPYTCQGRDLLGRALARWDRQ